MRASPANFRAAAGWTALGSMRALSAGSSALLISAVALVQRAPPPIAAAVGRYSVRLPKPLGIMFEEVETGKAQGVTVTGLVNGG